MLGYKPPQLSAMRNKSQIPDLQQLQIVIIADEDADAPRPELSYGTVGNPFLVLSARDQNLPSGDNALFIPSPAASSLASLTRLCSDF